MAEALAAIGIVASVAQLADYGFKLSIQLFAYSQAVSTADQSIKGLSHDISLTSSVLQELCRLMESDDSGLISTRAIEAIQQTVKECLQVFKELNDVLETSLENLGKSHTSDEKRKPKRRSIAFAKMKWPFQQPKVELLRSNLDRMTSSLTLMLQVLSMARDITNQWVCPISVLEPMFLTSCSKETKSSLAYHQELIKSFARSERAMQRKYDSLQAASESQSFPQMSSMNAVTLPQLSVTKELDASSNDLEELSAPSVRPRTLIGELLLCFQLLHDLLNHHQTIRVYSTASIRNYDQLRLALTRIQIDEENQLTVEHGGAQNYDRAKAVQSLQTRLRGFSMVASPLRDASASTVSSTTTSAGSKATRENFRHDREGVDHGEGSAPARQATTSYTDDTVLPLVATNSDIVSPQRSLLVLGPNEYSSMIPIQATDTDLGQMHCKLRLTIQLASCERTSTRLATVERDSTPYKIKRTTSQYLPKASVGVQIASGNNVCSP
jgi:hypothetical protein